jgi:tetratricopeptide (TPR) repeat protein
MTPFATKDVVTLALSALALAVALFSYFQKKAESTQGLRKRLTDVLKELSDLNLKDATFRSLEKKEGYPPNYIGLLADQRRFFVREGALLSDSLGTRVSPHEKNLIAQTFDNMDYIEDADRFFRSAAENSPPGIERGLAMRNYGRFLYRQGLFAGGKNKFDQAIAAFSGEDDRSRFYRNSTYVRWAESEFNENEDPIKAKALLEKAIVEASNLKSSRRRQRELKEIEKAASAMNLRGHTGELQNHVEDPKM